MTMDMKAANGAMYCLSLITIMLMHKVLSPRKGRRYMRSILEKRLEHSVFHNLVAELRLDTEYHRHCLSVLIGVLYRHLGGQEQENSAAGTLSEILPNCVFCCTQAIGNHIKRINECASLQ